MLSKHKTTIVVILDLALFAISFFTETTVFAILGILLLIVIISLVIYHSYDVNRPPWTILHHKFTMEITKEDGSEAVAEKSIEVRANHRSLQYFTHRNIGGDGSESDFESDDESSIIDDSSRAGDRQITVKFPNQIGRGKSVQTSLKYKLLDSFPSDFEGIITIIDRPMRELSIVIKFPNDRQPVPGTVGMIRRSMGNEDEVSLPRVNGNTVTWSESHWFRTVKNGDYELSWRW